MIDRALKCKLGILALFVFLGVGCSQEVSSTHEELPAVDYVARINNETISRDVMAQEFKQALKKFRIKKKDTVKEEELFWLRTHTLNELIKDSLLLQEAQRTGIRVDRMEFESYLHQIREGYTPEQFQKLLEIEEISPEEWDEKLKNQLIIKKLIREVVNSKVKVSEEEMRRYFIQHKGDFEKGEQVQALHIMVQSEEEARQALKWIEKGRDFSQVAREHSLALEAPQGGDMGYFEKGQLPEGFDPVFELKKDEVSEIIHTPYGYHVFKVIDKKPARKRDFEEARDEIHARLLERAEEEAFRKWLKEIKNNAQIEIHNEVLQQIS